MHVSMYSQMSFPSDVVLEDSWINTQGKGEQGCGQKASAVELRIPGKSRVFVPAMSVVFFPLCAHNSL